MFRGSSLTLRIVSLALMICAVFALALVWIITSVRSHLLVAHGEAPKVAVETAMSHVDYFVKQEQEGKVSRAEAQKSAIEVLRRLRFDGANYVWINDLGPSMVMHPFKPQLEGQDLSTNADPAGKRLFVEFVNVVRSSPKGEGTVDYLWPKPGETDPVQKISFVKLQKD
jgi:methyl-accepting chemotaxis protein